MGRKKTEAEQRRQRHFGLRVYSLRAEQGLTQEDVMNYGGIERSFLSNIENGVHAISSSRIPDLAEGLRVDLFDDDGDQTIPRYRQLADYLALEITTGLLQAGEVLKPPAEMCRHYGYSRFAVAKALALLRRQGIVHTQRDRTVVAGTPATPDSSVSSTNLKEFTV